MRLFILALIVTCSLVSCGKKDSTTTSGSTFTLTGGAS